MQRRRGQRRDEEKGKQREKEGEKEKRKEKRKPLSLSHTWFSFSVVLPKQVPYSISPGCLDI